MGGLSVGAIGEGSGLRVAVIGAGIGGLATAIRLQSKGVRVRVFEKRSEVGGKTSSLRDHGYTFDRFPCLVCPEPVVREFFDEVGASSDSYVKFARLEPYYRLYYHDRSYLDRSGSDAELARQMERFNKRDAKQLSSFYKAIKPLYELAVGDGYGEQGRFNRFLKAFSLVPSLAQHEAYLPVYFFAKRFFRDYRHRMLFGAEPTWMGKNPSTASALHLFVAYAERAYGLHFPVGGAGALARGMKNLFLDLGGELFLAEEVVEVKTSHKQAKGVRSVRGSYEADAVVSNADMGFAYRCLVDAEDRPFWDDRRINALEYSPGYYSLHLGLRKKYHLLRHHTFILSSSYKGLVEGVFAKKLPSELNCYLHAPSKSDPSMAPEGCEALSIHVPVPNLSAGVDWGKQQKAFGERLLSFLEEWGLADLRRSVQVQKVSTPLDAHREFNTPYGSAFSMADRWTDAIKLKSYIRSEDVANLYFVGDGGFPSTGLRATLIKSKKATDLLLGDLASKRRRP